MSTMADQLKEIERQLGILAKLLIAVLILICLLLALVLTLPAHAAEEQACIPTLCTDNGHPDAEIVWEHARTGERLIAACVPNDWWPFVRFTCLVEDQPIAEFSGAGTSKWIGASLRQPDDPMDPAMPVLRGSMMISPLDDAMMAGLDNEMVSSWNLIPDECLWTSKEKHPPILYVHSQPREQYPFPLAFEIRNVKLANWATYSTRCRAGGSWSGWSPASAWIYSGPSHDVTGDGQMLAEDITEIRASMGRAEGDPLFNPFADLDANGVIGISDLTLARALQGYFLAGPRWVKLPTLE